MKSQRLLVALTLANLLLFLLGLASTRPARAQQSAGEAQVLRGRALEIVDERGRVRASLSVLPASTSAHGDRSPETVLLRLITERGRPSVKISSSEEASGLSFAGTSGTRETWLILEAKGETSALKLSNENGKSRTFTP